MSDGPNAQGGANALGVVDPLRIPMPASLPRAWRGLPFLGRVFVGLTILEIVARAVGFAGTSLFLDLASPLSLVTAFAPHSLLILFPALLLLRRPDADRATPLVLRGAVVVALVALLGEPVGSLAIAAGSPEPIGASLVVSMSTVGLEAAGWIAIAIGLRRLAADEPTPFLAGLSNLVFVAIAGTSLVYLAWAVLGPKPSLGDPSLEGLYLLSSGVSIVGAVAWAFLGRVVVRGAGDPRRPFIARRLAAGAFAMIAVASVVEEVVAVVVMVMQDTFGPGPRAVPGQAAQDVIAATALASGVLGRVIGISAVVVAFGLGLADRSPRIGAAEPDATIDPRAQPVAWPAPAGDSAP